MRKIILLLLIFISMSVYSKENYLCFTAEEANSTIRFGRVEEKDKQNFTKMETRFNDGEWKSYTLDDTIHLPQIGDKVYFRGDYHSANEGATHRFFMTGTIAASGNIMTLTDYDHPSESLERKSFIFRELFKECTSLTHAPELPAIILSPGCYQAMFMECTSLIHTPQLPANEMKMWCYEDMFRDCHNLLDAPELPSVKLQNECYAYMFLRCYAMRNAPQLPATEVASRCYVYMFGDCRSLTKIPDLPATKLDVECYFGMFDGCKLITKAPDLPAKSLYWACYREMFNDCISLTESPFIAADSLEMTSCVNMFRGCTSLKKVRVAFTKWDPDNMRDEDRSTRNWLDNVAPEGEFECPAELPSKFGTSWIPEGWKRKNISK